MKWREIKAPDETRPTLESVLEFYGSRADRGMVPCILHEDRTPSMSINLDRQLWNCHSCGTGGDSYKLIMLKEGLDFGSARRYSTDHGLSSGDVDQGGKDVSRGRYARGGALPAGAGSGTPRGGYRPTWRRK